MQFSLCGLCIQNLTHHDWAFYNQASDAIKASGTLKALALNGSSDIYMHTYRNRSAKNVILFYLHIVMSDKDLSHETIAGAMLTSLRFIVHNSVCTISKFKDACHWLVPNGKFFFFFWSALSCLQCLFSVWEQCELRETLKCTHKPTFLGTLSAYMHKSSQEISRPVHDLSSFLSEVISMLHFSLSFIVFTRTETKQPK